MAESFAERIRARAVGDLHRLYDEAGVAVAELRPSRGDGLVYAYAPDAYPGELLGCFRLTVEQVGD